MPWRPEGKLSQQERVAQRKRVAEAQEELLAELAGTKHKVIGRYRFNPGIGLEVGPDALELLERSAVVSNVREDREVAL